MNRGIPSTFSDLITQLHEISSDIEVLSLNKPEQTQRLYSPKPNDNQMDWTPTINTNWAEPRMNHRRSGNKLSKCI
jgi:hypothetical protein